jgi:hypothetical protein
MEFCDLGNLPRHRCGGDVEASKEVGHQSLEFHRREQGGWLGSDVSVRDDRLAVFLLPDAPCTGYDKASIFAAMKCFVAGHPLCTAKSIEEPRYRTRRSGEVIMTTKMAVYFRHGRRDDRSSQCSGLYVELATIASSALC